MRRSARVSIALGICSLACASMTSRVRADDHPFVYAIDADGPRTPELDAMYSLGVGARESGAVRFVDPTLARPGVVHELGAQVGITSWLAVGAFGILALGPEATGAATAGGYVQSTLARPSESSQGGSFALRLSVHRELEGVPAASFWVLGSMRAGRWTAGGNLQLERRFTGRADTIDILVRTAVMYAVFAEWRVGVEYVGQDLEDLVENEEAEGGAAHVFAVATTAFLNDERVALGLAPGLVVTATDVGFIARAHVSCTF